mgnify:CR=1 FL=1
MKLKYKIIIPARKNSKRLKGKNLKILNGKPLIQHSIDYALLNFDKNDIWVNSDDNNIIKLSKSMKINSVDRPKKFSTDTTPTVDVLKFQLDYFRKKNIACDAIILLQPTNPFRSKKLLTNSINIFERSKRSSLATFSKSSIKLGKIQNDFFEPINYKFGQRSQDLNTFFFENGQIYISKIENINKGNIISDDVYPMITSDRGSYIDIDTMSDFIEAENYLKNLKDEK